MLLLTVYTKRNRNFRYVRRCNMWENRDRCTDKLGTLSVDNTQKYSRESKTFATTVKINEWNWRTLGETKEIRCKRNENCVQELKYSKIGRSKEMKLYFLEEQRRCLRDSTTTTGMQSLRQVWLENRSSGRRESLRKHKTPVGFWLQRLATLQLCSNTSEGRTATTVRAARSSETLTGSQNSIRCNNPERNAIRNAVVTTNVTKSSENVRSGGGGTWRCALLQACCYKVETARTPETSVSFYRLHGLASQNTAVFNF
jgi:hypothetical protein